MSRHIHFLMRMCIYKSMRFDRNIARDSGKKQNFSTGYGFDRYSGSGIR